MANSPFQSNPAFAKLSDDARKAVSQAFDAMSNWRSQMAELGDKNSDAVFDKMSEAAKALGWPTDFVEMSRKQVQSATKMQVQMVEQVMDTWEKQVEAASNGKMPDMPSFPGMPTFPGMPSFPGFTTGGQSNMAMPDFGSANPMQFWMQAAEMWQKNWQQAMSTWMDAQGSSTGKGNSGSGKSGSNR